MSIISTYFSVQEKSIVKWYGNGKHVEVLLDCVAV